MFGEGAGEKVCVGGSIGEDLERWLNGEPIHARPVGRLERFSLWCRRNPVVSGLITAVAASLLVGIVVSMYFAVQASRRAVAESRERARAEELLARSFVQSLDPDGEGKPWLSVPESEALWELAELGNTDMGLRFLDQATRDPVRAAAPS